MSVSYHQDYPTSQFVSDLVDLHLQTGACDYYSMARWLYINERHNWAKYMEAYGIEFNKS